MLLFISLDNFNCRHPTELFQQCKESVKTVLVNELLASVVDMRH